MTDHKGGTATTAFGFKNVAVEEKQGLVNEVFDTVATRYDVMNDAMSGGLHRAWKDAMVAWLAPPRAPRKLWRGLDVAGGTGDVAFRIAGKIDENAEVIVTDINPDMLMVGAERDAKRIRPRTPCRFVAGNAEALPLPDNTVDAYTIAFGIRNVTRRRKALAEARRVLKRGGRFLCLEFSEVDLPMIDKLYDVYSFNVIPWLGQQIAGDGEPYRYLVESIRTFPNPGRFGAEMEREGFERVDVRRLTGGVVAIHSGYKL
ncbi:MAG: bifunctional demethylmenaquinone methyltransferase/2-methoxy-6-polyprenyl-1,4-benzoquinol methylase UbiE [Pseudomonadota bacterium]